MRLTRESAQKELSEKGRTNVERQEKSHRNRRETTGWLMKLAKQAYRAVTPKVPSLKKKGAKPSNRIDGSRNIPGGLSSVIDWQIGKKKGKLAQGSPW